MIYIIYHIINVYDINYIYIYKHLYDLHSNQNAKTFLVNGWPSGKYVNLLYMYSILGRSSFCFNYCLNSVWHGGDQFSFHSTFC